MDSQRKPQNKKVPRCEHRGYGFRQKLSDLSNGIGKLHPT
jgi:hypothetical protein